MLINHYGLNVMDPQARAFLTKNMTAFFFKTGGSSDIDTSKKGTISTDDAEVERISRLSPRSPCGELHDDGHQHSRLRANGNAFAALDRLGSFLDDLARESRTNRVAEHAGRLCVG